MERSRVDAPSYLCWSVFNALCCCLPLGIAAIVYSVKADSASAHGDADGALQASRTARTLNIVSLVCGLVLLIVFIALKTAEAQQH